MNRFVDERWLESVQRLALGLEPVDAGGGGRVASGVDVALESYPQPPSAWRSFASGADLNTFLPRIQRHASCRYALLYAPRLATSLQMRLFDSSRTFVGRRLSVGIATEAEVEAAELSAAQAPVPTWRRIVRPALYPGAAYGVSRTATGLRGRVLRGGVPMRWARVEAVLPATGASVGWGHGDDRGEFVLIVHLKQDPTQVWSPADPMPIELNVYGPSSAPALPAAAVDPFWDLPVEPVPVLAPGVPNPVEAGVAPPSGYVKSASSPTSVSLPLARLSSARNGIPALEFT